ncbi:MAG: 16S rRNA (cytidine(1402)-2'-O)-methyltransferase, partial [Methyloligellaceae bacterium]
MSSIPDKKKRSKSVESLRVRADQALGELLDVPLSRGLYLVATPIGHLSDISLRALSTLAGASVIYCESPRHSRKLLSHYAIRSKIRAYNDH